MIYILKKNIIIIGIFLNFILVLNCTKHEITDNTVVAKIGDVKITVKDFRISYELTSKKPANTIPASKKAQLNSIIENKLLTIAGLKNKLDEKEDIQRLLNWYEKQAVVQELYRHIVRKQVTISDEEKRDGYALLNQRLFLRQLLFQSEFEADKIYRRLQNGETFEQLALELTNSEAEFQYILNPREFNWDELDERLETAAYGLNHNEISAPIKTNVGYHILQLVNRKENLILTESGFQDRDHYIETIIRRRKEATLAKKYATTLMEKLHPYVKSSVLMELTQLAKQSIKIEDPELSLPPYLQVRRLKPHLKNLQDKELVIFSEGVWTVGQVLNRIQQSHPKSRPDLTNPQTLPVALSVMVRDEFLAREGYKLQLEKSQTVHEEVNHIREEIVALRMRQTLLDTVQISNDEIQNHFTLEEKKQRILENFLERMKTNHPVSINESALSAIRTSDELGTGRPMDMLKIIRR